MYVYSFKSTKNYKLTATGRNKSLKLGLLCSSPYILRGP